MRGRMRTEVPQQSGRPWGGLCRRGGSGECPPVLAGPLSHPAARGRTRQAVAQQQYMQQQGAGQYSGMTQEVHTKYNPRTGQTFADRYKFDPNTGEELLPLQ